VSGFCLGHFTARGQTARAARRSAHRNIFLRLVLGIIPLSSLASAQQTTEATRFRSTTHLVVLDVVVTDTYGQPIRGYTAKDFRVLEDGVEQKVASFEPPALHPSPALPNNHTTFSTSGLTSIPSRNILVLDELNTGIIDEAYARQQLEKYLRKHGPVLNQPTSLIIVGQENLDFAHDYTRNAQTLLDALKRHHPELPFTRMTGGLYGSGERMAKTLWVLEQIASSSLHYAGRKNIIWIGAGVPEFTWRDLAPDDRHKFASAISETANVLFDARLVVYTINPHGLDAMPSVEGGTFSEQTTGELVFESLAPETGGKILRLQNNVDDEIAQCTEDGSAYYTLTYYPTNHVWDGQFRKIQVQMAGRGLTARVRRGYYAVADSPPSDEQVDAALSHALMSPLPYRALNVHSTVTPASPGSGKYMLRVDRDALYWQILDSGKRRCEITVLTATVGAGSRFTTNKIRELEAVIDAAQLQKAADKPIVFNFVAELPADTQAVKLVVRDSTNGNIGTAEIAKDGIKLR
jgi:VWFA-related protein